MIGDRRRGRGVAGGGMEFGVLGRLEVRSAGRTLRLVGRRQQRILATMLVHPDRVVPLSRLTAALWDDEPPSTAKRQVQNCVSDLRRQLTAGSAQPTIRADGTGYRLDLDDARVDLREFRRGLAEAERLAAQGRHADAADRFRAALGLWRGPALAGLSGRLLEAAAVALDELRLAATERCIDLELRLGRHADLVSELVELTAANPLRERLVGHLMVALHRSGRRVEAIEAYRRTSTRFADELGLEPGAALRDLHVAVLRDAVPPADEPTAGAGGPDHAADAPADPPTPSQLPADVRAFTGRVDALSRLDEALPRRAGPQPTTALPLTLITGTAGVGKTALAVHWGHRVRHRFPHGQLYVDLRGYASGEPVTPLEVLSRFLVALGCPPAHVPADVDRAADMYRTLLAERRVLIVLDNARGADQVRPLLPGNPGCVVLITSRDGLRGVVARDGARQVTLASLSEDESRSLLERLLGPTRVAAEPDAGRDLARLCAGLPLALRIATADLAERPQARLGDRVTRLRASDRLAALAVTGDDQAAVRTAFDLSYRGLDPPAASMFRRLGLNPGPDVTVAAAAALCDLSEPRAAALLEDLAAAHLIEERVPGRYSPHDLLRLYAAERAAVEEDDHQRAAAMRRLGEWCLRWADVAARTAFPEHLRLPPEVTEAGGDAAPVPAFADASAATGWLEAERANLVAVVLHTAEHGPRPVAWRLADAMRMYFWRSMYTAEWLAVGRAGLAAANADGPPAAVCAGHLGVADALMRLSCYPEAIANYRRALELAETAAWPAAQVTALACIGTAYRQIGRPVDAEPHLQRALAIARRIEEPYKEAVLLGYLGQAYRELGRLDDSEAALRQAEELFNARGARHGSAVTWGSLGQTYLEMGRLRAARERLGRAREVLRELGDRSGEAEIAVMLADLARRGGALQPARDVARDALELAEQINDRRVIAHAHTALGAVEHDLGRREDAVAHFRVAIDVTNHSHDRIPEIEARLGLARALGGSAAALAQARRALELSRDSGYRLLQRRAEALLSGEESGPDGH